MGEKSSFESAWSACFPQEKPPFIVCFSSTDDAAVGAPQDGEQRATLAQAVRESLGVQQRRLDDLRWQMDRQQFVVDYLAALLTRLGAHDQQAEVVKAEEDKLQQQELHPPPPQVPLTRAPSGAERREPLPTAPKPKPRPLVPKRSDAGASSSADGARVPGRPPPPPTSVTALDAHFDAAALPPRSPALAAVVSASGGGGSTAIVKRGSLPHASRPADGTPLSASGGIERSHSERPAVGRRPGGGSHGEPSVADAAAAPRAEAGDATTASADGGRVRAVGIRRKESDYVELWLSADKGGGDSRLGPPRPALADAVAGAGSDSSAAAADRVAAATAAHDDSGGSASSLCSGDGAGSSGGSLARSGSSRGGASKGLSNLVLVQYDAEGVSLVKSGVEAPPAASSSSPAPFTVLSGAASGGGGGGDSDTEEEPTYVRLVYKALSTVKLSGLSSSAGNLSVGSSGSELEEAAASHDTPDIAEAEQPSAPGDEKQQSEQADDPPVSATPAERLSERSYSTEEEKLKMRQWVISSIIESERFYVDDLDIVLSYKKNLEMATKSSSPLISSHDIDAIFGNIAKIHEVHQVFLNELQPIVSRCGPRAEVGAQFKYLSSYMPLYETYVGNWPNAIATLKRCCAETPRFQDLVSAIKCKSPAEKLHLEEILHKPINRIQRNTLVLHDLIQCTPHGHPDHDLLQRSLTVAHEFLGHMAVNGVGSESRLLVKNRLIVEHVSNKFRRLRHVFLFNDVLICTKPKIYRQKCQFEVKWHLPLCDLLLSNTLDDKPVEWKQRSDKAEKEISQMKARVHNLKAELRREMKETREKALLVAPVATVVETAAAGSSQRTERIKRKLEEEEAALAVAEPRLRFIIESRSGLRFAFLLSSDYERNEWHESLASLVSKAPPLRMSALEAQNVIDTCKDNVKLNSVGANILKEAMDQDIVSGTLIVTIHKLQDTPVPSTSKPATTDAYCAIEVDSFGHFHVKAKSHARASGEWNEEFELDLEAATTLRFICYRRTSTGDALIGKGALDLSKSWLRRGFDHETISLNEASLVISIQYRTAEQTIQRIPSRVASGVYGVKLSSTARKDGAAIPIIVTAAIREVEKRGFDEMGIYRVSGMTNDVQRIKKAFDKSSKTGCLLLEESDIHAVTGALKLYFRELPEALFTDELYASLLDGLNLSEPEAKEKCMVSLIASLPDTNYLTAVAMLNHLVKISSHEAQNKMTLQNLATVFGPTLLKPAQKPAGSSAAVTFSSGASDALYQTSILFYYLTLVAKGTKFR